MQLPLTKTLELKDYGYLVPELSLVDSIGTEGQHEHRRWEYSMALRALGQWRVEDPVRGAAKSGSIDAGGGGSNMNAMLSRAWDGAPSMIVDPGVNQTVEQVAASGLLTSYVVTCISVIEHVKDEFGFLQSLDKLVRPGGMLFLTMDCGDGSDGDQDKAHFHWMRERIYTPHTWMELGRRFTEQWGYRFLGDWDFSYNGHQLFSSYSFASLALVKKV